ncbi:MFS transporter [Actinomadura viridis]|uniref:MFS family permease n=1 Tax=Actinomadura viridis TaxID=58110 RepID=A0A931DQL5_9ACTN|nr:MFS transporter [Actinomadura viridis]MBG6090908.1 MFS family permease [Actinomadura viridis]
MTVADKTAERARSGRHPRQRRVLGVLTASQVLGGIGAGTGITISTLAAATLSGSEAVGGLAQTSAVAGAGVLAVPMARMADRHGRRAALSLAYGCAAVGMTIAAVAAALENWPLLAIGLFLAGGGSAGGLAARYAATDLSGPRHTARDLSLVVWATTIGSIAGPNLADPADRIGQELGLAPWAGPYGLAAITFGLTLVAIWALLRPDPLQTARLLQRPSAGEPQEEALPEPAGAAPAAPVAPGRGRRKGRARRGSGGWHVLRTVPRARLAVAGIVVSHVVMVSVMVMTPVHLNHGHAGLSVVGIVISLHITGMYALAPLPGWLADRFGRVPVLMAGMVLLAVATALAALSAPHHVTRLTIALVLLGLGWSFGLVGGSALLTESVPADRRPAVQGLSDLLMNAGAALGGLAAGVVVTALSYGALATGAMLLVLPMMAALVLSGRGPDPRRPDGRE